MADEIHTPGPWFVGAQNDALYITAGREPAINNDHPWHDAPRVVVAKVFGPTNQDCLPIDAHANARLIAKAPALHAFVAKIARMSLDSDPGAISQDHEDDGEVLERLIAEARGLELVSQQGDG